MTEGQNEKKKEQVPYVPFKTFLSALDSLAQAMPHTLDRSVFQNSSGAIQGQLLSAFRFFGLINDVGEPTPTLEALANDEKGRPAKLQKLLEKCYPELMELGLTKATSKSFNGVIASYGITGATLRKASSFFLQAARFSGLQLSPYILKKSRSASKNRKRRTGPKPKAKGVSGLDDSGHPPIQIPTGPTRIIGLEKGVTLTLATSADPFQMSATDRRFVMELLDTLEAYETKKKTPHKPSEAGKKGGAS